MSDEKASCLLQTRMPTPYGDFMMRAYNDARWPHLGLSYCADSDNTNNPAKLNQITAAGIEIVERVSLNMAANPHKAGYLNTKQVRMGHLLQTQALADILGVSQ